VPHTKPNWELDIWPQVEDQISLAIIAGLEKIKHEIKDMFEGTDNEYAHNRFVMLSPDFAIDDLGKVSARGERAAWRRRRESEASMEKATSERSEHGEGDERAKRAWRRGRASEASMEKATSERSEHGEGDERAKRAWRRRRFYARCMVRLERASEASMEKGTSCSVHGPPRASERSECEEGDASMLGA
jgi:hypothetical protein